MQQDAIRRVREMQRIANNRVNGGKADDRDTSAKSPFSEKSKKLSEKETLPIKKETSAEYLTSEKCALPEENASGDALLPMNADQDRLLLLLLLIVFLREGIDGKLLLALCYLLL